MRFFLGVFFFCRFPLDAVATFRAMLTCTHRWTVKLQGTLFLRHSQLKMVTSSAAPTVKHLHREQPKKFQPFKNTKFVSDPIAVKNLKFDILKLRRRSRDRHQTFANDSPLKIVTDRVIIRIVLKILAIISRFRLAWKISHLSWINNSADISVLSVAVEFLVRDLQDRLAIVEKMITTWPTKGWINIQWNPIRNLTTVPAGDGHLC